MPQTDEQKIAVYEDKIKRLKEKTRKKENQQKYIVGHVVIKRALNKSENSSNLAKFLLGALESDLTRPVDIAAVEPLIATLREFLADKESGSDEESNS